MEFGQTLRSKLMNEESRPRRVRGGRSAALVAAVAALLVPAGQAGATPPGGPKPSDNGATVKLSTDTAKPGGKIALTGRRWPAGKVVTIKLDDEKVGAIGILQINRRGGFAGPVTIPANVLKVLRPGRHWLRLLAPASQVNHQSNTSVKKTFTLVR